MSRAWCQSRSADLPATRLRLNCQEALVVADRHHCITAVVVVASACGRFPSRGVRLFQTVSSVSRLTRMESSSAAAASAAAGNSSDFVSLLVSWGGGKVLTVFSKTGPQIVQVSFRLPSKPLGGLLLRHMFALFTRNSGSDQMGDPGCWRIRRTRKLSAGGTKGIASWC